MKAAFIAAAGIWLAVGIGFAVWSGMPSISRELSEADRRNQLGWKLLIPWGFLGFAGIGLAAVMGVSP